MSEPQMMVLNRRGRGRPPRSGVASRDRVEFYVTAEERQALQQMASREGKGIASVVREAVNEFVADYGERKLFGR